MIYYLFTILLSILTDNDPDKIAKLNKQKEKTRIAYETGNYQQAITENNTLIDSMSFEEEIAKLNRTHAYYQLKDTVSSLNEYGQLAKSEDKQISSVANQQLGIMANQLQKPEEALEFFKKSLRADPTNEDSRYNYELLKKLMEQQQQDQQQQNQEQDQQNQDQQQDQQQEQQQNQDQQNQDQQNQDQQNQDQQNQDQQEQDQQQQDQQQQDQQQQDQQQQDQQQQDQQQQDQQQQQEGKEGDQKEDQQNPEQQGQEPQPEEQMSKEELKEQQMKEIQQKLEQLNISPEKAKMILEAMKNNEAQYLQQNKRKATKRKDSSKPDW